MSVGVIISKLNLNKKDIEAIQINDEQINKQYQLLLENLFDYRNKAILQENEDILKELYDVEKKTGLWANEHEVEKNEGEE